MKLLAKLLVWLKMKGICCWCRTLSHEFPFRVDPGIFVPECAMGAFIHLECGGH